MRVLLISNYQLEYSIQLANALAKLSEVTLVVWDNLPGYLESLVNPEVKLVRFDRRNWRTSVRQLHVARFCANFNADVLHFQSAYVWSTPWALTLLHTPKVLTIHDPSPHFGIPDPWSFLATSLQATTSRAIVVLGNAQKKSLLSRFRLDPRRIHVVPHGEFSFFSKFATETRPERQIVLFIGRVAKYKGIACLLEAAALVSQRVPQVRFRIVGEGDLSPYGRVLRGLPNVEVNNKFVSPGQFADEIRRSAVVIAPYLDASQSGVVVAAQSLGRPIIASNVGGLAEDVLDQETGILVQPGNARVLANAIVELMANPEKVRTMGHKAQEWMKSERDWTKIATRTQEVYEAIL